MKFLSVFILICTSHFSVAESVLWISEHHDSTGDRSIYNTTDLGYSETAAFLEELGAISVEVDDSVPITIELLMPHSLIILGLSETGEIPTELEVDAILTYVNFGGKLLVLCGGNGTSGLYANSVAVPLSVTFDDIQSNENGEANIFLPDELTENVSSIVVAGPNYLIGTNVLGYHQDKGVLARTDLGAGTAVFWSDDWIFMNVIIEPGSLQLIQNFQLIQTTMGDFDQDQDLDLNDFSMFQNCMQSGPPESQCYLVDFDRDNDIDFLDYGQFSSRFTGNCGVLVIASPDDQSVCPGDAVTFEVLAEGINLNYQWYKDGILIPNATEPSFAIDSVDEDHEGEYRANVIGECIQTYSNPGSLIVTDALQIISQPVGGNFCIGDSAELSVDVTGELLSFQWYRNSVLIPDAVNSTYSIGNIGTENFGDYHCIITDGCGEVISETAGLAFDAVAFEIQPVGDIVCIGDTIFLFATATGFPDYQWFKGDLPILGATEVFFAIPEASTEDSGIYYVFAINECNSLDISDTANVTVESCDP